MKCERPTDPVSVMRQSEGFLLTSANDHDLPELYRRRDLLSTSQEMERMSLPPMSYAFLSTGKSIVLVGLMGAGKTCIGRRLARRLQMSFVDADEEIVKAAGAPVVEIFRRYGESAFRE